jgi:uncharacterized protein YecA (UPF0149 family)
MEDYQNLQKCYVVTEINENCVDIDFAYAFICGMANSELELVQWMPMLFLSEEVGFSNEKIASEFAQAVLTLYENTCENFLQKKPLLLPCEISVKSYNEATKHFASGYLQALMLIDNSQGLRFTEGSIEGDLQQTCLLLLDKLATTETEDQNKLALFEQLPSESEIVILLPSLLSRFGQQCLLVGNQ